MILESVLSREEAVRTGTVTDDVDPWTMRFIVDDTVNTVPISHWRSESARARQLLRRWTIQSTYRERTRDVERRIDAMLLLAESLEMTWDAAAESSEVLAIEANRDADAFEKKKQALAEEQANEALREAAKLQKKMRRQDQLDAAKRTTGEVADIARRFTSTKAKQLWKRIGK